MPIALLTHPDCSLHDMGPGHPERPDRLKAVLAALRTSAIASALQEIEAPEADRSQLVRAHDPRYVDALFAAAPRAGLVRLDPDTAMNRHSLPAALRAAGAAVRAVDLVLAGEAEAAFCAIRPPGHHAERNRAMGFCLFNNVAIGALHALAAHGLERVAIVDFDVHHGNGTEDIVRNDPRLLFCSSFQHPFYPGIGTGPTARNIIHVPLPAGTDGPVWREAVAAAWLDPLARFAPQLVLYSAGFDAHRDDPLAELALEADDYRWLTETVGLATAESCARRAVSVLEGGYHLEALGQSAVAHIEGLRAGRAHHEDSDAPRWGRRQADKP